MAGSENQIPEDALAAWTDYEPPEIRPPFRDMHLAVMQRHAFISGYLAAKRDTPAKPN